MDVFTSHREFVRARPSRAPAIAIGNFDGVHRGHLELIARTRRFATTNDCPAVVLTFEPHPAKVLAPSAAPKLLTTTQRKLELLAAAGADACILEPFDRQLASLSPDAFAKDILATSLGARHLVVGFNFSFGKGRAGNADTLRAMGEALGFSVEVVEPFTIEGEVASSSRIRGLVAAGDLGLATTLLGRPFDVDGVVVRGAGRGRTLGIPTANVESDADLMPPLGIYAVWLSIEEETGGGERARIAGAASLGTNPTFDSSGRQTLEVHLLDFDRDIYGKRVRVEFVERLRGEERFDSAEQLMDQIRLDIARTATILSIQQRSVK